MAAKRVRHLSLGTLGTANVSRTAHVVKISTNRRKTALPLAYPTKSDKTDRVKGALVVGWPGFGSVWVWGSWA